MFKLAKKAIMTLYRVSKSNLLVICEYQEEIDSFLREVLGENFRNLRLEEMEEHIDSQVSRYKDK